MATGNLTQAEGVLKIVGGEYTVNYETTPSLFNRANKGSGNPLSDRGFEIPTEIEGNWAHGWPTDGGDWPAGGSIQTIRPRIYFKEYAHSCRLTIRAIKTIKPDAAYIKSWTEKNLDGSIRAGYKMNNIYAWGTGNGVLGTISTGANSTTQTLNNTNNVRYLRFGMRISIYDPTLTTLRGSATITSHPTPGQTTITIDTAINSTTSDVVTIFGGANQAITGMSVIADDTTNGPVVFQDVNRNTYRNYRAQVINASSDGLDVEILNRMIGAKIQVAMGGVDRDNYEIWSYMSQTAAYASLGYNLKRYEGKSMSMDLGYTTYDFQGMNWVEEVDCEKNGVYFMAFDELEKFVAKTWGWEDTDGRILRMVPSDTSGIAYTSQVEGYWTCDWNLGSPDPRQFGHIINLAVPAGY
jgi:hypothetical protein